MRPYLYEPSDVELVHDALDHIDVLKRHLTRGDLADAVSLCLASAIDAVSETSGEFREQHFGDDWKIIWATRNCIAHGYTYIDLAIIRDAVEHDRSEFEHLLRKTSRSCTADFPRSNIETHKGSVGPALLHLRVDAARKRNPDCPPELTTFSWKWLFI